MLPINEFLDFIKQQQLFEMDNKILLAISGGKDSVLMLHLFKRLKINIGVAHCNFGLRADEAQRDEHFVKMLAQSFNLPFYVTHFDTKKYASENKISTQMAARALRYQWFEQVSVEEGYDFIAIAQHQSDVVETVLINLIRGTGISGLHGILPKRGKLIRPLLFLNREEINRLAEDNHIDFVEDASNLSSNYTRNKLRIEVIPHLKNINPNLENTFSQNINRFAEVEAFLNLQVQQMAKEIVSKKTDGIYIKLAEIGSLKPQKLLLYELLKPYGFSESVTEEILNAVNKQSGIKFYSTSHQAVIDRENLIIIEIVRLVNPSKIIHQADAQFEFNGYHFHFSFSDELKFEAVKNKIHLDEKSLQFPLIVRTWQYGDKFIPLGMNRFKKLSDFFIDEKIPLHLKTSLPILVNGNGELIWIAGMRQDNRYKLTSSTKKVAIFEVQIK